MAIEIVTDSSERIFPPSYAHDAPKSSVITTPLSIIDATVANFAAGAIVWFFDGSLTKKQPGLSTCHLREALRQTLEAYPQWCGRLQQTPYEAGGSSPAQHNRCGRVEICHGSLQDPGVLLIIARSSSDINSIIPTRQERRSQHALWDRNISSAADFLSDVRLAAPSSDAPDTSFPAVVIQITAMACGGFVVAMRTAHSLTDAHSLTRFIQDWAQVSRALLAKAPAPALSPLFKPSLLDEEASGDVNAAEPNKKLVDLAHSLPLLRYDWWASRHDAPFPIHLPNAFRSNPVTDIPSGTRMPWDEWNLAAPTSHYVIHYRGEQVTHIWESASASTTTRISRHDALVAHVWACLNRARGFTSDSDAVLHCHITFGLRARLSLGDDFVGSPIMMADVAMQAREACAAGRIAAQMRSTLGAFDPPAIRAHLHAVWYEATPQRIWQAFLGRRHVIVTSCVHTGAFAVDFGAGRPCHVEPVMPRVDGCISMIEAAPDHTGGGGAPGEEKQDGTTAAATGAATNKGPGHWSDDGVNVSITCSADAMQRLLLDPLLHS